MQRLKKKPFFDTIAVLGEGISSEGELPDFIYPRLEKIIELWKQGVAPWIVLSGKWSFLSKNRPPLTEAEAIKKYLVKRGIPESYLLKEEESMDTVSNAYFLKTRYFLPHRWTSILVPIYSFRLERTRYIFQKILGPKFQLKFLVFRAPLPGFKLATIEKMQKLALERFKRYFAKIRAGDHLVFKNIFYTHSYYQEKRPAFQQKFASEGKS